MSVRKFVANENGALNITKGLNTEDINLSRTRKSMQVKSVEAGDTVFFRRADGINTHGRVLEVGKSGELLVMEKAVLPREQDQEKLLTAGQYYRSKASSLTKAKDGDKEPIYPQVKVGQEVAYKDADGNTKHAKVASLGMGGHVFIKIGDKIDKLDPSAYWPASEGKEYMDWEASFTKAKKNPKEKIKIGKEKERSLAGEHIGRHKEKYGMDQKQAVATWLNEARNKGVINYPKKGKSEDADLEAYIGRAMQLPAPIKNPEAKTPAGKEGRKIWPEDAKMDKDLDGTTAAPVPVRSSTGDVSGYKWPKKDLDADALKEWMRKKEGKSNEKSAKSTKPTAKGMQKSKGKEVQKGESKKETGADRAAKSNKAGSQEHLAEQDLKAEKSINALCAKIAKNIQKLGEKHPAETIAWLQKSFTSKKKEAVWKRAVAHGKKYGPDKLDKAVKKKVSKAQSTQADHAHSGPLKGSPAYEKWITTFRLHHPQVFNVFARGGKKDLNKLKNISAKKLEEILSKEIPYKEKLRRLRQYAGVGGTKSVAGTRPKTLGAKAEKSMRDKAAKGKSVKDVKATEGKQVLPSQAPDQKGMSDRKFPVSEFPPRSR